MTEKIKNKKIMYGKYVAQLFLLGFFFFFSVLLFAAYLFSIVVKLYSPLVLGAISIWGPLSCPLLEGLKQVDRTGELRRLYMLSIWAAFFRACLWWRDTLYFHAHYYDLSSTLLDTDTMIALWIFSLVMFVPNTTGFQTRCVDYGVVVYYGVMYQAAEWQHQSL